MILTKEKISWSSLRAIQRTKFIGSMYVWVLIVPVAAKVFQKVEELVALNVFGHVFRLQLSLPFSWQAFFWCAIFFGLANALTVAFAPRIVKEQNNAAEFISAKKGDLHLEQYAKEIGHGHSRYDWEQYAQSDEVMRRRYEAHLVGSFWKLSEHANKTKPWVRYVCALCYSMGLLLLGYVLLVNTIWVIRYMFG